MYLTPPIIFFLSWLFPLTANYFFESPLLPSLESGAKELVILNIFLFFLIYWAVKKINLGRNRINIDNQLFIFNINDYEKRILLIFKIYLLFYLINVIFSGGLPIFWVLSGDERSYLDFGVPSFSGFLNTIRAFLLMSCAIMYYILQPKHHDRYLYIGIFLLITPFFLENSRGQGAILLLHVVALFFLYKKITLSQFFKAVFVVASLLVFMGLLQAIRYGEGLDYLREYAASSGFSDVDSPLLLTLVPAVTYIVVPLTNLDLNLANADLLSFEPYYTIRSFIPSFLRDYLYQRQDYGILINEGNNVSTFYISYIRDFGVIGSIICSSFIFTIISYVYIKARKGGLFFIYCWGPLFMSLTLMFFWDFFTSLSVLFFPIFSYIALYNIKILNRNYMSV